MRNAVFLRVRIDNKSVCDSLVIWRLSGRKRSSFTRLDPTTNSSRCSRSWCKHRRFWSFNYSSESRSVFVREFLALSDAVFGRLRLAVFSAMWLHDRTMDLLGNMLISYLLGRDLKDRYSDSGIFSFSRISLRDGRRTWSPVSHAVE